MSERLVPTAHDSLRGMRHNIRKPDIADLKSTTERLWHFLPRHQPLAVHEIPDGEHAAVLSTIIDRVEANTNYFHHYREAGIVTALENDEPFEFHDARVIWHSEESRGNNHAGHYSWDSDIHIAKKRPHPFQMLKELNLNAAFPDAIRTLHHERIHAIQDPNFQVFQIGLGRFKRGFKFRDPSMFFAPTELIEAQAYRMAQYPAYDYDESAVINHVTAPDIHGKHSYAVEVPKMLYAVRMFDKLDALGLTTEQIAELFIAPGKWSKKTESYPLLDHALNQVMMQNNVSDADLPTLMLAHNLESQIDRIRALTIIREEIQGKQHTPEEARHLERTRNELARLGIRQIQ